MKSVKMMLSAAAIFAVVGASLAFTPKNLSQHCLYYKLTATSTDCPFRQLINEGNDQQRQFAVIDDSCPEEVDPALCVNTINFDGE